MTAFASIIIVDYLIVVYVINLDLFDTIEYF